MGAEQLYFEAATAQASYALFVGSLGPPTAGLDLNALVQVGQGEFVLSQAGQYLGLGPNNELLPSGVVRIAHQADSLDGFSVTVFETRDGQSVLAIRGTAGVTDLLQDAKLLVQGVPT